MWNEKVMEPNYHLSIIHYFFLFESSSRMAMALM